MSEPAPPAVSALVERAVAARVTPGAVVEAGSGGGVRWRTARGALTYAADAPPVRESTIYDLASLTKVMAAGALAMRAALAGTLPLDATLAARLPRFAGRGRDRITVADLLGHSAGFPAHRAYYHRVAGRCGFLAAMAAEPLAYVPGERAEYTDLGFMLVGFLLEDAFEAPLASAFAAFAAEALGNARVAYDPPEAWQAEIAPTEIDAWRGRVVAGRVHDANAAALGGAAGHAGLFGDADAVGRFARWFLQRWRGLAGTAAEQREAARFATAGAVPGSSRALAWDTMRPTSSCGRRLSPRAIGHTGFTGTSLWIDPDRDLYVVLLTNRVHPSSAATTDGIRDLRVAVHDAVAEEWRP